MASMKQNVRCSKLDSKQRKWTLIGSKNFLQRPRNQLGLLTTERGTRDANIQQHPFAKMAKWGPRLLVKSTSTPTTLNILLRYLQHNFARKLATSLSLESERIYCCISRFSVELKLRYSGCCRRGLSLCRTP